METATRNAIQVKMKLSFFFDWYHVRTHWLPFSHDVYCNRFQAEMGCANILKHPFYRVNSHISFIIDIDLIPTADYVFCH
jgi:hypothetical protein